MSPHSLPPPVDFTPVHGGPASSASAPVPPPGAGTPRAAGVAARPFPGPLAADAFQLRAAEARIRQSGPAASGLRPRVILGPDDTRQPVTQLNLFPWRVHVFLEITWPHKGPETGTGWLVSASTVLTAGHCVCSEGRFATFIRATPAGGTPLLCQAQGPGGHWTFDTTQAWQSQGDLRADIGAIFLPQTVGNQLGWLGLEALDDQALNALNHPQLSVSGYPADKPPGSLWTATEPLVKFDPWQLYYSTATERGESGSPILLWPDGALPVAIGLHHYGVPGVSNQGIRIIPALLQQISRWCV